MRIRLYENLRTVSYAPFYFAQAKGFYAESGVDVVTVPSPRPEETALGLMEGRADVSFGGPMRVLLNHDRDSACPLVCFGQVVGRDPFMLIGAEPNPEFRLSELAKLRVGVVSEVPTPWMLLQDDLGRSGIDPLTIDCGPERTMAENVAAMLDGELDVVQVMEPAAATALASGRAHCWHRFSVRGNLAFTTFYAPRAFLESQAPACASLTAAVTKSISALYASPATDLAAVLAGWFPNLPAPVLSAALKGYQEAEIWTRDPSIAVSHLVKLKAALLSGGLISNDIPYEAVVDDRFAAESGH